MLMRDPQYKLIFRRKVLDDEKDMFYTSSESPESEGSDSKLMIASSEESSNAQV